MSDPRTVTAASAAVFMTLFAVSVLSDGKQIPLLQQTEDKNLWFERDENMEWTKKMLNSLQRGGKGKSGGEPPNRGPHQRRRRQNRQP